MKYPPLLVLGVVLLGTHACSKTDASREPAPASTRGPVGSAPSPGDAHYVLAATPGPCKAGEVCTVSVRLEAKGKYHINAEYPYKLKMSAEGGDAAFLGKDPAGANVFSKPAGDFRQDGEKAAVMTVALKPSARGALTVHGTYKFSVCSEENCELETAEVSTPLPVD